MNRTYRMAAIALAAAGVAFGATTSPAAAAANSQTKASCLGGDIAKNDHPETIIVGHMTFCPYGDKVSVSDMAYDGRSLGLRIDDGSGTYRWCKDTSGADDVAKHCNFNLREGVNVKFRAYQEKKGSKTIWLDTRTILNKN
ncbi:hypothetical protein ABZ638_27690 [Streptomyces sp. NPDC007107]|uniref:hypothetical protein n=1 Tax=Streptomyces sp. NPDC007107 TaxID=3156915 RepID=UPI0033D9377B